MEAVAKTAAPEAAVLIKDLRFIERLVFSMRVLFSKN